MGDAVTPQELMGELHRRGVELAADAAGVMILFRPADRVTPELRAELAAHKPALLALLTAGTAPADGEAAEARGVPFALTSRRTAEAVSAWVLAGAPQAPTADPVATGLALLALRRRWRRSATRRR